MNYENSYQLFFPKTKVHQVKAVQNVKNVKKGNTSGVPPQDVQIFIDLFKGVNPSYERLFRNQGIEIKYSIKIP